jgi:hypothetical protein
MAERGTIDSKTAIDRLIGTADFLRIAYERLVADWQPDAPPLTVIFADLGRSLCRHVNALPEATARELCLVIEDLMAHGDENVKNAVATGMLEAILSESSSNRFNLEAIARWFGPHTTAYCLAWDAFTGVPSTWHTPNQ